jgi:hypothetical protein
MREDRRPAVHRIGDLVGEIMRATAKPRRRELGELAAAWERAVGPELSRRSRPVAFREGRLTVSFESAALRQEVASFRKDEILGRLRSEYASGRIAALRCVLGL